MWPFFTHHGVLGLNARNFLYIKPFNPKRAIALADDKLKTKAFLAARGVPTAKIYARIESREQLHEFAFSTLPDASIRDSVSKGLLASILAVVALALPG